MRIATWNVNSLRARLPRVEEWVEQVRPDVLCLQETKLADDAFPSLSLAALGYEAAHVGQGRWNGVAVASRVGLEDVVVGFPDADPPDEEARLVWARCGGVRVASVYVPNGREVGHEQYEYKLRFLDRLRRSLDAHAPDDPLVLAGDFNVAPDDRDVWDPDAFAGATHVSEAERRELRSLLEWGLVDLFRQHHEPGGLFSWWDYRAGSFHKGRGMRIDLLLGTRPVADALGAILIDRNARKGKSPSDHAPVVADLDLEVVGPTPAER